MGLIHIDRNLCCRDGLCVTVCPAKVFVARNGEIPLVTPESERKCFSCGHCVAVCPAGAIDHGQIPLDQTQPLGPALSMEPSVLDQMLKARRSIRHFRSEPVPRELVSQAIDTARWAPSAVNRQPAHWLVIQNKTDVERLAGLVIDFLRRSVELAPRYGEMLRQWDRGEDPVLRHAPHLLVLHASRDWNWSPVDCAIALTQFELAAVSRGIGTCWGGFLMRAANGHPPLREALGIPEGHDVYGAMMFGFSRIEYRRIPARLAARIEWR